jgi:outer membrane lipoprotein-sorting protein
MIAGLHLHRDPQRVPYPPRWAAAAQPPSPHAKYLALALLAAALGCAHAPAVRAYPAPDVTTLTALLTARQQAVSGMNARARATSWLGGDRVRATVNMLVQRDGHLRFEAEVSLQGTVAILATDGTTFALYDAHKNELSRGPACPANVASLIRIPLAPADVAAVLLGDARLPNGVPEAGAFVAWDPSRGADALALRDRAGGALHLFFRGQGPGRQLIAVVRTGPDGSRLWQTAYDDFETAAGVAMPKLIRFAEHNGSFEDGVEIRFKDRSVNAPAPASAFTIAPPPGVPVRDVGCAEELPEAGPREGAPKEGGP